MNYRSVGGKELVTKVHISSLASNHCPICGSKGKRLLRKTLANHVFPKYWLLINEPGYYFCPDKECPIVYFNNSSSNYFVQSELRTPVMHKQRVGTENRAACYCKNVLEQTIIEELTVKKCCDSLIDIQNFTEANTGKDCSITNPTGRCCGAEIREIMEFVKESHEIEVPLLEEALSCCAKIEEVSAIELDSPLDHHVPSGN